MNTIGGDQDIAAGSPNAVLCETVYIIDDDMEMRSAMDRLLRSVGLKVEGFDSVQAFLSNMQPPLAGCLILDVRLPGLSGLEFQRNAKELGCSLPIIFITGHGDIAMAVAAMKAGAIDFLPKPFNEQALLDAVNAGYESDRTSRREADLRTQALSTFATLTLRERQVMIEVIAGLMNKQIAAKLGINTVTVKQHRHEMMRKMNVTNVPDLVRIGLRLGL